MFLKFLQNSQENTCAIVSEDCYIIYKRDSGTDVFLYILRNLKEHLFSRWLLLNPILHVLYFFSNCSSSFLTISHKNYIVNRVFKSFISNQKLSIEIIKNKIKNRLQRKSDEKKQPQFRIPWFQIFAYSTVKLPLLTEKNVYEFIKKILSAMRKKLHATTYSKDSKV